MAKKKKPPGWDLVDRSIEGEYKCVDAMTAALERHYDMQRGVQRLGFLSVQDFLNTKRAMPHDEFGRLIMEMHKLAAEQTGGA